MSAFVCEEDLFDALATYARLARISYYFNGNRHDMQDAKRIAQVLLDENQRSVNYRYRETDAAPAYTYRLYSGIMKPVQILKAANCLEYQSCETDDWDKSEAKQILEAIVAHAIRSLPGYEDAEHGMPANPNRKSHAPSVIELRF